MRAQQTNIFKNVAAWRDAIGLSVPSLPADRQVIAQSRIVNASRSLSRFFREAFHFYPWPESQIKFTFSTL